MIDAKPEVDPEVAELEAELAEGTLGAQRQLSAFERIEERARQGRSFLGLRGKRARRPSVLTSRDYANEARRVRRAADRAGIDSEAALEHPFPDIEFISSQPDANRAARRHYGIHHIIGSANEPYVKPREDNE